MIKIYFAAFMVFISSSCFALPEPQNKKAYNMLLESLRSVAVKDEIRAIRNNKKSFFMDEAFRSITTQSLYNAYKNNEIAANKKFKNKELRIKGVAQSISEDFAGGGIIKTEPVDTFLGSTIFNVDKNDDYVLSLSSGDKIDMICKGGGFIMGSPILNNCISTKKYVLEKLDSGDYNNKINNLIEGIAYFSYMVYPDVINKNCSERITCETLVKNVMNGKVAVTSLGITEEDNKKRFMKLFKFFHDNKREIEAKYPYFTDRNLADL